MVNRVTFAVAIHEAHDPDHRPWIYATEPGDKGHGLYVAHCVETCPEPAECSCEEQTFIEADPLIALCVQAIGAEAVRRDLEEWDDDDADTILQYALWGRKVFE